MKKYSKTHTVITCALFIALQIVFVRLLSVESGSIRISFGFIPVAIAGMLLGPVGGGITGAVADFLGMLLFSKGTVYFFPLTISEFLYGAGFGSILHKREFSPVMISLFTGVQFIFINLFLNSFWLYLYYIIIVGTEKGFGVILWSRLVAACFNFPAQIVGVNLINRYLKEPLRKFGR